MGEELSEISQQVKVAASKPDHLSLTPMEGENRLWQVVLCCSPSCGDIVLPTYTIYTHNNFLNVMKIKKKNNQLNENKQKQNLHVDFQQGKKMKFQID